MKEELFSSKDYRPIIKSISRDKKISQKDLAGWARVHTSYFSRVMKGEADFSPSQMHSIAKALGMTGPHLEYLILTSEMSQSTEQSHRQYIKSKMRECQKQMGQLESRFHNIKKELDENEIKKYFEQAITAKIHMYFTIESYCQNINLVRKELNIDEDKFNDEIEKLEKLGLVKRKGNKVEPLNRSIHLDEDHDLSKLNHLNWRLETVHKLTHSKKKHNDYHFTVNFSATDKEKELIKARFKEFIVDAQKIVSETDKVSKCYHLSFDLY